MGQHKVEGASKGPDYKKEQHLGSPHISYYPSGCREGVTIKTHYGKQYVMTKEGAWRRLSPTPKLSKKS
jgi:hypothetical protein